MVALILFVGLGSPSTTLTADSNVGRIAVIEADPTILQPGEPFDLAGTTMTFTPRSEGGYSIAAGPIAMEPELGANLNLTDNSSSNVTLGFSFPYFGSAYGAVFVNANGNLTFGMASAQTHFNNGSPTSIGGTPTILNAISEGLPRIAALWQNWNPPGGGGVFANLYSDRFVVTWNNVPLLGTATYATFQVVMFDGGTIQFSYASVPVTPAGGFLSGISPGSGSPFYTTTVDFSAGIAGSISRDPDFEPLVQTFGSSASPLVHLPAVSRRFFERHSDRFDQLAVFSTFPQSLGNALAFELTVNQRLVGIGQGLYDISSFYGSAGVLQGVLAMGRLTFYPSDPNATITGARTHSSLDLMAHETGHQWLAFVEFDDNGVCSNRLLGRQLAHWSFFHDTLASDLEGNAWRDNGNGTFTTFAATERYSPLDQYLMGLRTPVEVPDFLLIDGVSGTTHTPSSPPRLNETVSGLRRDVRVDDIIACEGPRVPSAMLSSINGSNTWRQAFILLVPAGTSAVATDVAKLDGLRDAWVGYFNRATDGRANVDTDLGDPLPDLVSAIGEVPAHAFPTSSFAVSDVAFNNGTAGAASTTTRYLLSKDTLRNTGDILLAAARAVAALSPGESSSGGATLTVPTNTALGTYFVLACADYANVVVEYSNLNNCAASASTITVGRPDLVPSTVGNPPPQGTRTSSFAVADSIRNLGTATAGTSTARYYLSLDSARNTGDVLLTGSRGVPALGLTESSGGAATLTIPATAPPGSYLLLVCADDLKKVTELSETNNCLASTAAINVVVPDLTVSAITDPPQAAFAGASIAVGSDVTNVGQWIAPGSTLRYYLSVDVVKNSGDGLIGTVTTPPLEAGVRWSTATSTLLPTNTTPGTYYLLACADDLKQVSEGSETNNCRASAAQIVINP